MNQQKKTKYPNFQKNNSGAPLVKVEILDNSLECPRHCSLVAKDSEWIDMLGGSSNNASTEDDCNTPSGEKIVQPEEDSQIQPLTRMFPNLLQEDPGTLEAIVSKTISTTEVTKHLIGHKANFKFVKKVNRLIPPDKEWLARLTECSNSSDSSAFSINDKCSPSYIGKPMIIESEIDTYPAINNLKK